MGAECLLGACVVGGGVGTGQAPNALCPEGKLERHQQNPMSGAPGLSDIVKELQVGGTPASSMGSMFSFQQNTIH